MQFLLWLPVLIGIGCIAAAFVPVRRGRVSHPVVTTGVVVGSRTQTVWKNRSETQALAPVIRYETPGGEITAASRYYVPEWQYSHRTGDRVRICYDRTQPDLFCLCDDGGAWRKTALLTFGIGSITAYAVLWLQYR